MIPSVQKELEMKLLKEALTYKEASEKLKEQFNIIVKPASLRYRNVTLYKINRQEELRNSLQRNPVIKLQVDDIFGKKFSPCFDGDGSFDVSISENNVYSLGIVFKQRADSEDFVTWIKDNLGVGEVHEGQGYETSQVKGTSIFRVKRIDQLYEVIIPFFDRYPLKTKKKLEYPYWRELVEDRYILTLRGQAGQKLSNEYKDKFLRYAKIISQLRNTGRRKYINSI
ncbi:hypothetical protein EJF36_19105 [Bacillus sp. HMF5848]|uniref:LAGLIDADG family homing endonuclease n=1 Tax=Bacillus sp. HMF5848 TaxID=2495421 RepID=UPI000F766F22|nr:LAGLIDADG family homing endonuclease [Bacillus sp. HMF5848]RSK28814.1 hypothetical protein EJF36_19105 [Bacillus sp. HMF5848]